MNNQFIDDAINYILHSMSIEERIIYEEKISKFDNEQQDEFDQIKNSILSMPLALERNKAPESIKTKIFEEIVKEESNLVKMTAKRSFNSFYAIAASILLTFFITRYIYDTQNSSNLTNSDNGLFKTVSNVHEAEREKINSALCLAAKGTNMSLSDAKGEMHYGKLFYNRNSKSSVIHICYLPKQDDKKYYTLWLKDSEESFVKLETFEAINGIQELNYLVKKEFLNDKNKLLITLEEGLNSNLPSSNIMLANL